MQINHRINVLAHFSNIKNTWLAYDLQRTTLILIIHSTRSYSFNYIILVGRMFLNFKRYIQYNVCMSIIQYNITLNEPPLSCVD